MKKLLVVPLIALTGCVNFHVASTTFDPDTHVAITNVFNGHFFFAKSTAEKIDVAYKTKTTSKLFGAKSIETTGDVELVKAVSALAQDAFLAGAKAAVKP